METDRELKKSIEYLFEECRKNDLLFQRVDEETGERFCYLHFTDDIAVLCPYANTDKKVLMNKRYYNCCNRRSNQ